MRRRSNLYAGGDVSRWTTDQLRLLLSLQPGELQPLGFARWQHDPAELLGFATRDLMQMQAVARRELATRQ